MKMDYSSIRGSQPYGFYPNERRKGAPLGPQKGCNNNSNDSDNIDDNNDNGVKSL